MSFIRKLDTITHSMKYIITLLALTFLTACGDDGLPDLIKFKSGEYGSRTGAFIAKFPSEPSVQSQHFDMGEVAEYDQFSFQYNRANEHIYTVSYVDFPTDILASWEPEQLFDQTIKTMSSQLGDLRISKRIVNSEENYELSVTYTLNSSTPGEMMKSKMVMHDKRVYQILFMCRRRQPEDQKIDEFIESFRIYKPKESV